MRKKQQTFRVVFYLRASPEVRLAMLETSIVVPAALFLALPWFLSILKPGSSGSHIFSELIVSVQ